MKKGILFLAMVVALVAVMVMPMTALAGTTTVSGDVPLAPTISDITPNTGSVSTAPSVVITGTNFVDGQTSVTILGDTGITVGDLTVTSTTITTTFTIAAGATSEARNVKVTVYGLDSNTDKTFSVNIYATLVVPASVSIPATGKLNLTQANNSAAQTVSCTTNEAAKASATVTVSGTNAGKLTSVVPTSLSSALSLGGIGFTTVSLTGDAQTLVDAGQGALSGTPNTWSKSTLVITQPAFTTVAAGSYSCTITFTATFNN